MKATYNPATKTKFTTAHRKEGKCFFRSLVVIDLASKPHAPSGEMSQPLVARLYGTGAENTACLWINTTNKKHLDGLHVSGSGKASGGGYHRPSAALGEAIRNAGFTLSEDINGRGESAMKEAMMALAKEVGLRRPALVESYQ